MTKGEAIDFYDAIMKLKNGELKKILVGPNINYRIKIC